MAKLEVPKGLLVGLAGVSAVAVLGIAFLLGRESGRRAPGQRGSQGVSQEPDAPGIPAVHPVAFPDPGQHPVPDVPAAAQASGGGTLAPTEHGLPLPSGTIPSGRAILQNDPERASVAAYFRAIDNIQPGSNGDPEALARQVVTGLGKGDTSGFDDMIRQAEEARRRLSAILPPSPCAAYHRDSLASLAAGLDLVLAMKKALSASGQGSQVSELADRANALKARTDALQIQENALRQRYGLMK